MRTRRWLGLLAVVALGCSPGDKDDSASGSEETGDDGSGAGDDGSGDDGSGDGGSGDDGSGDDGSGDDGSGDGGSGDDGSDDGGEVDWDSLNGDVPRSPVSAPEFAAVNFDGSARSREDLLGHPTVMWFYPAAATSG